MPVRKKMPFLIILASSSPRRRAFFKKLKIPHCVIKPEIDENRKSNESIKNYLIRIAAAKASKALELSGNTLSTRKLLIVSCDTIVVLKNKIFGKPSSKNEARKMLKMLSGKTHEVVSCLYILKASAKTKTVKHKIITTKVSFKKLSETEIDYYLSLNEYSDKAGSYAAQGIGAFMIAKIDGSFTNVIGLPLAETLDFIKKPLFAVLSIKNQS
jgi:septum formation protein